MRPADFLGFIAVMIAAFGVPMGADAIRTMIGG